MRWMNLRYAGTCKNCGTGIAKATRAIYLPDEKKVLCAACAAVMHPGLPDPDPTAVLDPSATTYRRPTTKVSHAPSTVAGHHYLDPELTRQVLSFLRLAAGYDETGVLAPGAEALLAKFSAAMPGTTDPVHLTASETIYAGGEPADVILRCPFCKTLTESHECKEYQP